MRRSVFYVHNTRNTVFAEHPSASALGAIESHCDSDDANSLRHNVKTPLPRGNGEWAMQGSNLRSPPCKGDSHEIQGQYSQDLSEVVSTVCTRVCTSDQNAGRSELLELLAVALRGLLPTEDRQRLAVSLLDSDDLSMTRIDDQV